MWPDRETKFVNATRAQGNYQSTSDAQGCKSKMKAQILLSRAGSSRQPNHLLTWHLM
jgi:hypothetical protein